MSLPTSWVKMTQREKHLWKLCNRVKARQQGNVDCFQSAIASKTPDDLAFVNRAKGKLEMIQSIINALEGDDFFLSVDAGQ